MVLRLFDKILHIQAKLTNETEIARDAAETRVEAMQAQVADLQSQVLSLLSFNLHQQKMIRLSLILH